MLGGLCCECAGVCVGVCMRECTYSGSGLGKLVLTYDCGFTGICSPMLCAVIVKLVLLLFAMPVWLLGLRDRTTMCENAFMTWKTNRQCAKKEKRW